MADETKNAIASWEIYLKSGQTVKIKGGWNDVKNCKGINDGKLEIFGLRQLVEDFELFITKGTSPIQKRRYRYEPNGSSKSSHGYIYIDVKEIASITQLHG